ncbi:FG-GAP-like repeat-containing protein [Kitasatospora sp. NPDC089509]|uniref:FG-GAP-like repeat-containing protein n=1 Tax=Kitasatospora sp. NPDC089509 TaxID=3364079 RepID=UPI00380E4A53
MQQNATLAEQPGRRRGVRRAALAATVFTAGLLAPAALTVQATAAGCGTAPAPRTPLAPNEPLAPNAPLAAAPSASGWTGSWGTAMGSGETSAGSGVTGRQTLRMVVHTSIGGSSTRIHLVNTFSPDPVTIGHVTVAAQSSGSSATAAPVGLTFGGAQQTVIPAGGEVYSDAANFPVGGDQNLLVSIWLPNGVTTAPFHSYTLTTSYTSAAGDGADHTLDRAGTNLPNAISQWAYLSGLDVTAAGSGGTVVALGDSQVDGGHTSYDTNSRWTDDLGRVLRLGPRPMGIVNKGISGNQLLTDATVPLAGFGQSALSRFDRDVLSQSGAKRVILYEGINDIVMNNASDTALEAGIRQLASRAHAAGLKLTVATIPPYQGYGGWTAAGEQTRQCLNAYLRGTTDIDGYYDFDRTLRDPLNPSALFAGYYNHGDDHLHYNDNAAQAIADSIATGPAPAGLTLNYSQTTAGAFHGNGVSDLIARNDATGHLVEWPGYGDGSFGDPVDLTGGWEGFSQTTAGNFHGTGRADLVARQDSTGNLYLWPGNGDGSFGEKTLLTGGWGGFSQTTAGDFRGTGHADLVAREDSTGNLYLWPGNGDGSFGEKTQLTNGWGGFSQTTAGDFRGTGHADLVAREDSTGNLYLWPGNGDGGFGEKTLLTGGWGAFSQTTAGTFYGTGRAHLIARNDATGVLNEWANTGNASFSRPLRLTSGW